MIIIYVIMDSIVFKGEGLVIINFMLLSTAKQGDNVLGSVRLSVRGHSHG